MSPTPPQKASPFADLLDRHIEAVLIEDAGLVASVSGAKAVQPRCDATLVSCAIAGADTRSVAVAAKILKLTDGIPSSVDGASRCVLQ